MLQQAGHVVTSRWLDAEGFGEGGKDAHEKTNAARMDLADIRKSDALVLVSEAHKTYNGPGGKHVEFGYAAARGLRLFVLGRRENVFHWLPEVTLVETTMELIEEMQRGDGQ